MLDLYRAEAENLTQALSAGINALDRNPASAETLENCMRAAHSFKGASRIVGLIAGVTVSRALEECFAAAARGSIVLRPAAIVLTLRAVDLLARIARTDESEFGVWAGVRRPEIEAALASLKHVLEGAPGSESAAQAMQDFEATLPRWRTAPKVADTAPALDDADRMTLLELFHIESEALSQSLLTNLKSLQNDIHAVDALEMCMRAAHSLKGAARIVGLGAAMRLAKGLEDIFVAAQKGKITLRPGYFGLLQRAAELLQKITRTEESGFAEWTPEKHPEVDALAEGLRRVLESAAKLDTPAAPPLHRTG
jgi:two-component system sensor histidine kinase and response regulator WspE